MDGHEFSAAATGLCRFCGQTARAHSDPSSAPLDDVAEFPHARHNDPATSREAGASINITRDARRVLVAYTDGSELLDVEAYDRAGFPMTNNRGQRCSDLRIAGFIERTGERRATPNGRAGYVCRITPAGRAFAWNPPAGDPNPDDRLMAALDAVEEAG